MRGTDRRRHRRWSSAMLTSTSSSRGASSRALLISRRSNQRRRESSASVSVGWPPCPLVRESTTSPLAPPIANSRRDRDQSRPARYPASNVSPAPTASMNSTGGVRWVRIHRVTPRADGTSIATLDGDITAELAHDLSIAAAVKDSLLGSHVAQPRWARTRPSHEQRPGPNAHDGSQFVSTDVDTPAARKRANARGSASRILPRHQVVRRRVYVSRRTVWQGSQVGGASAESSRRGEMARFASRASITVTPVSVDATPPRGGRCLRRPR